MGHASSRSADGTASKGQGAIMATTITEGASRPSGRSFTNEKNAHFAHLIANSKTEVSNKGYGWLKNGNSPGDPSLAARCGAKTRRGSACQAPAMKNGRCRLHGGTSTGPRTPEGLERCRMANWKHGAYSKEVMAERLRIRELLHHSEELLAGISGNRPRRL